MLFLALKANILTSNFYLLSKMVDSIKVACKAIKLGRNSSLNQIFVQMHIPNGTKLYCSSYCDEYNFLTISDQTIA